jgi:hypothetical protein
VTDKNQQDACKSSYKLQDVIVRFEPKLECVYKLSNTPQYNISSPFNGSRVVTYGQTEIKRLRGASLQLSVVNAPKERLSAAKE